MLPVLSMREEVGLRKLTSVLALGAAALGSIATKTAPPLASVELDAVEVAIDPSEPGPLTLEFEAGWSEDAPRRAEIEGGELHLNVFGPDGGEVPPGIVVTYSDRNGQASVSQEGGLTAELPIFWTADEASGGGEIAFELPADTPAFTVFVEALVVLDLDDYDGEFIEGEVRLSGPGVP
jgi:hypothetical protein